MPETEEMVKDAVTKLEEFAALMHAHDLDYQYADDHRRWARGDEQRQALLSLAADLSRVEVEVIVELTATTRIDKALVPHYVERFMADLDRRRV